MVQSPAGDNPTLRKVEAEERAPLHPPGRLPIGQIGTVRAAPPSTLIRLPQAPPAAVLRPQQHHGRPLSAPGSSDPSRSGPLW